MSRGLRGPRRQVRRTVGQGLTLRIIGASFVVVRGESTEIPLQLIRTTEQGPVVLQTENLPAGVSAVFEPAVVPDGSTAVTLTLTATLEAPLTVMDRVQLVATAGGSEARASMAVSVNPPVSGWISNRTLAIAQGWSETVRVVIVRQPTATAPVTVSFAGTLPTGVSVVGLPATVPESTTEVLVTVQAAANAALTDTAELVLQFAVDGHLPVQKRVTLNVVNDGPYRRFAPRVSLPRNVLGEPVRFDSTTGGTVGDVYRPALPTPAELATTTNVVRVRESGGDYTPAQFQQVLNAAAADTTQDWTIVVDHGVVLTGSSATYEDGVFRLPAKPAESQRWVNVVPASWFDGLWTPAMDRPLDMDTELPWLYQITNTASNGNAPYFRSQDVPGVRRYRVFGLRIDRSSAFTGFHLGGLLNLTAGTGPRDISSLPRELVFAWCFLDGKNRGQGTHGGTRRTVWQDAYQILFKGCTFIGASGTGSDSQAVLSGCGQFHQYEDCLLEAASENYMSGGLTPFLHEVTADVVFRRCYFPKVQQNNPASHLYISTGYQGNSEVPIAKNPFELKHGKRMLLEDCVFENSWAQAQTGKGISLSAVNQSKTDATPTIYEVSDITILNCIQRGTAEGIAINTTESVNVKPIHRIHVVNTLLVLGPNRQVNRGPGFQGEWLLHTRSPLYTWAVTHHRELVGDTILQWCTFAHEKTGSDLPRTNFILPGNRTRQYRQEPDGTGITDCVIMDGYYRMQQEPSNTNGVGVLRNAFIGFARNLWVSAGQVAGASSYNPADFVADFPEQAAPAGLWAATRAALGFNNPALYDYGLAPGSQGKGLALDGNDPGVDMVLLQQRTVPVRRIPAALTIEWVPPPA